MQGGGHSNIFAAPEDVKPHARPKYDQQNSSNLNFVMNTVDPNLLVEDSGSNEAKSEEPAAVHATAPTEESADSSETEIRSNGSAAQPQSEAENLPKNHHYRSTALW